MKPRALVVEDDDRIVDSIEDALFSIGHDHEWVTNQHDAQQLLREGDYSYVLLDLQIPAKPNRGGANKEFGVNLLGDIQRIKGLGQLPVIVMTAYSADCLDLSTELFAGGASDFIAKPFLNEGRTLAKVIRKVLADHERHAPPAPPPDGRSFAGGELTFFVDHVELCGVKIIMDLGTGQSLRLLNELRHKDHQDHFVRRSAEELAATIGALGGVGTITGCIRTIRKNVVRRLARHLGVTCRSDDLIRNDEQGYYLREWITACNGGDAIRGHGDTGGELPQGRDTDQRGRRGGK
jgi:CheY-like chemotaxis protein